MLSNISLIPRTHLNIVFNLKHSLNELHKNIIVPKFPSQEIRTSTLNKTLIRKLPLASRETEKNTSTSAQ